MAQISSLGAFPEPGVHLQRGNFSPAAAKTNSAAKPATAPQAADQAETSPTQAQLSRLSGVLNSLQNNAASTRAKYVQVADQVRSGTYQVDSQSVSRSIVDDSLNG